MRCLICGGVGADQHHLKSRGSGGSDHKNNLMPLCRAHHVEIHQIGMVTFAEKYLDAEEALLARGWQLCPFRGRWVNYSTEILSGAPERPQ